MQTITVPLGERSYPIHIERGLLAKTGEMIRENLGDIAVAVVSDDHVAPLYMEEVVSSMEKVGLRVCSIVLPHGEQTKCLKSLETLYAFLCEHHLTRKDAIVALGGGVIGDLAGLAAATYLRGVHFVQLPTTLLAAVDSSVGGKTAVDLPAGKNLAGAFYQPELVLCDLDTLDSLPREIFLDGCAEVIKYAVLGSRELFALLADIPSGKGLEEVTARCVEMKRDFVQSDELDRGARQMLNLGHTFGHAVEASSRFTLSHGKSVAIGMAMILRAACSRGLCSAEMRDAVIALLQRYGL
ncbi:MAG: 3-dehydroquinate synthase, partial [Clostridiales bacterium]|nr:3-dehydroquinate synthase [Clostridiales bacterium]